MESFIKTTNPVPIELNPSKKRRSKRDYKNALYKRDEFFKWLDKHPNGEQLRKELNDADSDFRKKMRKLNGQNEYFWRKMNVSDMVKKDYKWLI